MENDKIELVRLNIDSPSGRCSYSFVFLEDGKSEVFFTKKSSSSDSVTESKEHFQVSPDELTRLKSLHDQLLNSKVEQGKLWKGGWHYKIFIDEEKKVDVYKKEDSKNIEILIEIIKECSHIKIDYNCF